MKVGDIVTWKDPQSDEEDDVFEVVELRGDRVLMQLRDWDHGKIIPQTVARIEDIKVTT